MAKRFTATEIWEEDWFLDMGAEYKLFWYYMLAACNHAGVFKANVKLFNSTNSVNVSLKNALEYFNNGKQRVRVINESTWLIEDFFVFQYGHTFNIKNRVHNSIGKEYKRLGINENEIRGLTYPIVGVNDGVKDKDKDKDLLEDTTTTDSTVLIDETTKQHIAVNPNRPKDAPTWDQVCFYFNHINRREQAAAFYNHFEGTLWRDRSGKPLGHWQSKANTWASNSSEAAKPQGDDDGYGNRIDRKKHPDWPNGIPYTPSNILRKSRNLSLETWDQIQAH